MSSYSSWEAPKRPQNHRNARAKVRVRCTLPSQQQVNAFNARNNAKALADRRAQLQLQSLKSLGTDLTGPAAAFPPPFPPPERPEGSSGGTQDAAEGDDSSTDLSQVSLEEAERRRKDERDSEAVEAENKYSVAAPVLSPKEEHPSVHRVQDSSSTWELPEHQQNHRQEFRALHSELSVPGALESFAPVGKKGMKVRLTQHSGVQGDPEDSSSLPRMEGLDPRTAPVLPVVLATQKH